MDAQIGVTVFGLKPLLFLCCGHQVTSFQALTNSLSTDNYDIYMECIFDIDKCILLFKPLINKDNIIINFSIKTVDNFFFGA